MKIFNVLVLLFTGVNTFSNWNDKIFVANPKEDIKVIDKVQINVISKLWYEQIDAKAKMSIDDIVDDDDDDNVDEENSHKIYIALNKALKQIDRMSNDPVLKQINMLESILQKSDPNYVYMSWNPIEKKRNVSDILALIAAKKIEENLDIECIVCNPKYIWSVNIKLIELKKALEQLSNPITYSLFNKKENKRIELEWSFEK